jgi:putative protease
MKSAEYVASIVGAYRKVLDAEPAGLPAALGAARELIKQSYGRVPTKGFLDSRTPADIATPALRGATGRFLGEIKSVRGDRIHFESRDRLHIGDRLRIQPKSDMAGKGFTIREIFAENRQVKSAAERSRVAVTSPFTAAVGDAVFKVSSETAFTMSENACLKRLESVKRRQLPCDLHFSSQGGILVISAETAGLRETLSFPLAGDEPASNSDMTEVFRGQFAKAGDTPFLLRNLSAGNFPRILIPPAALKEIRKEFYRKLASRIVPLLEKERGERRAKALAALPAKKPVSAARRPQLIVRAEKSTDLHLLHRDGVDALALPLSRANLHQLSQISRRLRGREERIIWRLPFMIGDDDIRWYSDAIKWLLESGFCRFEAANISHFRMLREHRDIALRPVEISTDYRLFSLNSLALLAWHDLGATEVTLYIEDDVDNMAQLLAADTPLRCRVLLHGEVPAITSKIAIKGVKNDAPVLSDRGDGYRVTVRDGLTQITPTRRFSITQYRDRLQSLGCGSFILDLANLEKPGQEQVLAAYAAGRELPETSPFNFLQGLV